MGVGVGPLLCVLLTLQCLCIESLPATEEWWNKDLPLDYNRVFDHQRFSLNMSRCWTAEGRIAMLSWAECCSAGTAQNNSLKCQEEIEGFSFERCCQHHTAYTVEGFVRVTSTRSFIQPGVCPDHLAHVCKHAANRTGRARRTRRLVQRRLSQSTALPETASIPVLGFPVAFDYNSLSLRLLRSIDFPVGRLFMVASGIAPHLDRLVAEARRLRPDLQVLRFASNLGSAGGFNEVAHAAPQAPWWLVASHDVAFPKGALARIAAATWEALAEERRGGALAPGVRYFRNRGQPIHAMTAFAWTPRAVAAAGLFDENLYPANAEDIDYVLRMRIFEAEAGRAVRDEGIEVVHGPEECSAESQQDMRYCSGIWNAMHKRGALRSAEGADSMEAAAEQAAQEEARRQLASANNFDIHVMQKFGPLDRADARPEYVLGASGPFNVDTVGWDDWILDPNRRACILEGRDVCSFDVRLLEQAAWNASGRWPVWSAWFRWMATSIDDLGPAHLEGDAEPAEGAAQENTPARQPGQRSTYQDKLVALRAWLADVNLDRLGDHLIRMGISEPRDLLDLEESDLQELGIRRMERVRWERAMEALRAAAPEAHQA